MPRPLADAAFAGYPSDGSGDRSRFAIGGDPVRTGCVGDGMPDANRTWSEPVVGA